MFPTAVGAHGAVVNASPEPATAVGGTLDEISIVFDDPVTDASMSIDGPDRSNLSSTFTHRAPTWLNLSVDPLTVEGRYIVRYQITTELGREVDAAFWFDFDRAADAAVPVVADSVAEWPEQSNSSAIVTLALSVVSVAVVGWFVNETRKKMSGSKPIPGD